MHIPDGFLSAPTAAAAGALSFGAVAYSVRKATNELSERTVPLLGVTAAFVFAAQMLNFPVAGGTSGHFLGAVLVAALMGPYAATVVLTSVLLVQSLVMADGGITALGANVLNMAVIGGMLGYLIFVGLKRLFPRTVTGYFVSLTIASWLSVVLASVACSLELAASGTVPLSFALPAMSSVHMIIGIGEALITSTVVAAVLASRPDLVRSYDLSSGPLARGKTGVFGRRGRVWGFAACAGVVAVALAIFVSPFASRSPDALAKVAASNATASAAATQPVWDQAPLKDYIFPGIHASGEAKAIAGGIGTVFLFGLVLMVGRLLGRRKAAPCAGPSPDGPSPAWGGPGADAA